MGLALAIVGVLGLFLLASKSDGATAAPASAPPFSLTSGSIVAKTGETWILMFHVDHPATFDATARDDFLRGFDKAMQGIVTKSDEKWMDDSTLMVGIQYAKDTTLQVGSTITTPEGSMTFLSATRVPITPP